MTQTLLIENDEQTSFKVYFDYEPPCRGSRERGTGLQLEPDEDASFEIEKVELVYSATEEIICELDELFLNAGRFMEMVESDWREMQSQAEEYAAEARYEQLQEEKWGL